MTVYLWTVDGYIMILLCVLHVTVSRQWWDCGGTCRPLDWILFLSSRRPQKINGGMNIGVYLHFYGLYPSLMFDRVCANVSGTDNSMYVE